MVLNTVPIISSLQRGHAHVNCLSLPQDGEKVIGYRKAMTLEKQPKKLVIVGSGAIGVEFAYFYNSWEPM